MKKLSVFFILFSVFGLTISCGGKKESVKNNLNSDSSSAKQGATIVVEEGSVDELVYQGSYTLGGVPENLSRASSLSIEIAESSNIREIQYAIATGPCVDVLEYVNHRDLLSPFTIDLSKYHSEIQLCIRGVDSAGVASSQVQTFTWTQGYPEIMNKALRGPCYASGSGTFIAARNQIEFTHAGAGEPVQVSIFNRRYPNGGCSGGSLNTTPTEISGFSFAAETLRFELDANDYLFKVGLDEDGLLAITSGGGWNFPEDRSFSIVELEVNED